MAVKSETTFSQVPKRPELVAFGNRMKTLREKKGRKFSQERLGFISGLHRNYISDAERGTRNVSLVAMLKIIKALDCSVSDFFAEGFETVDLSDLTKLRNKANNNK